MVELNIAAKSLMEAQARRFNLFQKLSNMNIKIDLFKLLECDDEQFVAIEMFYSECR
ncbi:hypothetical protein [Fusobacterium ulcerans]|uniref:hypothetical protein n=1 Tax=Fusobacterium ulcerans TaxID=861 RepID=UPI002E7680A8|nr:hypothetical protein [Fusobacterium ulcerans]MEE0139026.1 hypothetical protein [Fusobacterium ulcerans]